MPSTLIGHDLIGSIIDSFYTVYNYFGFGFAESVYMGALELELCDRGHTVVRELAVSVSYNGRHVAWQRLDMVVDAKVIVEAKATEKLPPYAQRQLINYLHATSFELGMLLHFGPEPAFQRYVHSNKKAFARPRDS